WTPDTTDPGASDRRGSVTGAARPEERELKRLYASSTNVSHSVWSLWLTAQPGSPHRSASVLTQIPAARACLLCPPRSRVHGNLTTYPSIRFAALLMPVPAMILPSGLHL